MAFVSWDQTISDLKDALADMVSGGSPMTSEYTIGGKKHVIRSAEDIETLLDMCYRMKARESSTIRKSFGRYRRFQ